MKQYMLTESEITLLKELGHATTTIKSGRIYSNFAFSIESVTIFGETFTEEAHKDRYGYTWRNGRYFFLSNSGNRLEVVPFRYGKTGPFDGYTTPDTIEAHALKYGHEEIA